MNNMAYKLDQPYCDGCGQRPGPLGCCTTISQLKAQLTMYEFTLKEISKTKTMTLRGECCKTDTCMPANDGSACAFRLGANHAFQHLARAADSILAPEAQIS